MPERGVGEHVGEELPIVMPEMDINRNKRQIVNQIRKELESYVNKNVDKCYVKPGI